MNKYERITIVLEKDYISPYEIQDIIWNDKSYLEYKQEDRDKLLNLIIKSAEANDGDGHICNQLGAMYAEGKLVEEDPVMSYEWYKKSSDLCYPLGTSNLGFSYMYGLGTEINYEEAFKCFSEAANFGVMDAVIRLGDMYSFGNYVDKNNRKAYMLYVQAYRTVKNNLKDLQSYQVYSDATIRLGNCYYFGQGVEQDLLQAYHFYSEAYYYYLLRKEMGDSYYHSGLKKSREKVMQILPEIEVL